MWGGGGGGGAQQLQCKSESVQCSEKQQSPCEGGGGLKLEKNKCWNNNQVYTIKSTKKLGIGSPVFCTFAFTPNQITAA